MRRLVVLVTILSLFAQVPWAAQHASADEPVYQYQQGKRAPIEIHRTYTVVGTRAGAACAYRYPAIVTPRGFVAWEVRDVGVDTQRCVKLVVEGIPASLEAAGGDTRVTETYGDVRPGTRPARGPGLQRPFAVTRKSGYTDVWWEDLAFLLLNRDKTLVIWDFDGVCATGGATTGKWEWQSGTGWYLYSNGGSNTTYCTYHLGETYSEFRNNSFCSPDVVFTDYYYVHFRGYSDGTAGGSYSSDTIYECAPVFRYVRVVITS